METKRGVRMALERSDVVTAIAERAGLTIKQAALALNAFQEVLVESLSTGGGIKLTGFLSIERVERAARTGWNPRTGEEIQIPAGFGVKIAAGSLLKKAVVEEDFQAGFMEGFRAPIHDRTGAPNRPEVPSWGSDRAPTRGEIDASIARLDPTRLTPTPYGDPRVPHRRYPLTDAERSAIRKAVEREWQVLRSAAPQLFDSYMLDFATRRAARDVLRNRSLPSGHEYAPYAYPEDRRQ